MIRTKKSRLIFMFIGVLCGALCAVPGGAAQTPAATPALRSTLVVAASGAGDFKSVQQAVDALPETGGTIRIRPGTYREQILIAKPHVHLIGLGKNPSQVVLTYNLSHHDTGSTSGSASTTVTGDDFLSENLTFQNTYSDEHPDALVDVQAVALRVTGDREIFRHVRILSHQDTLYADSRTCHAGGGNAASAPKTSGPACLASRQIYFDSYIAGTIDFIFGDAKAVFERTEIRSRPHDLGTLTAQSRLYPEEDSGYLFDHCVLTADSSVTDVYLGRPWRAYSTVIFLHTEMGAQINPAGWIEWEHDGKSGLAASFYAEYRSTGAGAPHGSARIPQEKFLTPSDAAKYSIRDFLRGDDNWNPKP
jgi:pectin methylesterase-like acyl-CoA thioesterase